MMWKVKRFSVFANLINKIYSQLNALDIGSVAEGKSKKKQFDDSREQDPMLPLSKLNPIAVNIVIRSLVAT